MFSSVVFAVLLFIFAATESALITFENIKDVVNEIGDLTRKEAQKVEELVQDEANIVGKQTKEKFSEVEEWVMDETNAGEKWAKEEFNEVESWMQNKMMDTEEFLKVLVPKFNGENCLCYRQTCGCCIHVEEPEIHLNSTVCVNITYLSEDYGITFTVTLNNHTLYNETVSVKNPPPVCVGFPYVKELADICIRLYDIEAKSHTFHACARLEARMKFILIAHYDLGCFTIGSSTVEDKKEPNGIRIYNPSVVLI